MRTVTLAEFHADRSERAKDPNGGELELYELKDGDGYVGELRFLLVIPSPDPVACAPFVVHRLPNKKAIQTLIDSLTEALRT